MLSSVNATCDLDLRYTRVMNPPTPLAAEAMLGKRAEDLWAGIAVAHSILVIAYHVLRNAVTFNHLGADYFDRMNTVKLKRYHLRRLAELGCDVSLAVPG